MTEERAIYDYGSCHFSERLDKDDAVGNGGYGVVRYTTKRKSMLTLGKRETTSWKRTLTPIHINIQVAEQQGKIFSGKKNLPTDLKAKDCSVAEPGFFCSDHMVGDTRNISPDSFLNGIVLFMDKESFSVR